MLDQSDIGRRRPPSGLLEEARSGEYQYEHQEDSEQTVRVWGDTAVITAKLWAKGMKKGTAFDYEPGRFEVGRHLELLRKAGFSGPKSLAQLEQNLEDPTAAQNYACLVAVK